MHYDRWWNPAVEDQATDRAWRIGQSRTVFVHKLVCEGTVEEKIDALINDKRSLADAVVGTTGEAWLSELSTDDLRDLVVLDHSRRSRSRIDEHRHRPRAVPRRAAPRRQAGQHAAVGGRGRHGRPARFRRGKTYVAEGAVTRLQVSPGQLLATVTGSRVDAVPGDRRRRPIERPDLSSPELLRAQINRLTPEGGELMVSCTLPRRRRPVQARRGRAAGVRRRAGLAPRAAGRVALRTRGDGAHGPAVGRGRAAQRAPPALGSATAARVARRAVGAVGDRSGRQFFGTLPPAAARRAARARQMPAVRCWATIDLRGESSQRTRGPRHSIDARPMRSGPTLGRSSTAPAAPQSSSMP